MTEYTIRSIMRSNGPVLAEDMPIRRAVAILVDTRAAVAVVCSDDGRMIGLLSQKDCFKPALHASYYREWTRLVGDYMSRTVVSVEADDEVIQVAEMFLQYPHRVFPVRDGTRVAGVIHRSDVLGFLSRIG